MHRMTKRQQLIAVGEATGVILPEDFLVRLGLRPGDAVVVSDTPEGDLRLAAADAGSDEKMTLVEEIMREDHEILRVLAQ